MKAQIVVATLALAPLLAGDQETTMTLDEALRAGEQWLRENLDEEALKSLGEIDEEQARAVLRELQRRFQGEYVIDLAALRKVALAALPVLEQVEAAKPYAAWWRTRLDYLE
ncbi:MAG: hypothetical protein HXY18_20210, partial [Bryobacteraceae bacterium]|nr:hypothetical protein [Bryobacteraceae bacterium]